MRWLDEKDFEDPEAESQRLAKIVREDPKDPKAWYALGALYACFLEFPKAIECSQEAAQLEPTNTLYHALLAYASANNGDDQDAIEALARLAELGAEDDDYYVELAICAECGVDNELVWHKIMDLRNSGKDSVAKKLEQWLLNPAC